MGSARVLHDVHSLLNEMQPQTPGPNIIQRTCAQLFAVHSGALVYQHDLETRSRLTAGSILCTAAQQFDWLFRPASIGVTNNIGQGFINGARQGSALCNRKTKLLGQAHHRAAHYAQNFGIAGQLQPKEPACAMQLEASLPGRARQTARIGAKSILVQSRFGSNKSLRDRTRCASCDPAPPLRSSRLNNNKRKRATTGILCPRLNSQLCRSPTSGSPASARTKQPWFTRLPMNGSGSRCGWNFREQQDGYRLCHLPTSCLRRPSHPGGHF